MNKLGNDSRASEMQFGVNSIHKTCRNRAHLECMESFFTGNNLDVGGSIGFELESMRGETERVHMKS